MKRFIDVSISIVALAILAPVLFSIAMLIWREMGRPVIFCQERPGYKGRPFTIHKFRTINDKPDIEGQLQSDSERLTHFGRFLRATSLDELLEFLNVLKGDMGIVWPRPLLMQYLDRYTPQQARRHEVKPRINGWAQVNGSNALSW